MTTGMIFASLIVTLISSWTGASWPTCVDALASYQWWQHTLLSVSAQLVEIILVISFVHVGQLRQSDLITTALIFQFIKVVLASPDNIDSIICSALTADTYEIWRLVGAVVEIASRIWRNIVATRTPLWIDSMRLVVGLALMHVVPIVGVILRRLLTIDERYSLDVVLLMVVLAVVPALDQFSLCSFQANRSYSFCSVAGNAHVCHWLV